MGPYVGRFGHLRQAACKVRDRGQERTAISDTKCTQFVLRERAGV